MCLLWGGNGKEGGEQEDVLKRVLAATKATAAHDVIKAGVEFAPDLRSAARRSTGNGRNAQVPAGRGAP